MLLALLSIPAAVAQVDYTNARKIGPDELRYDFYVFRSALETNHPGIYWYTPKEELDAQFDAVAAQLDAPMTDLEYYRLINPIVAQLRCGHTFAKVPAPYNQLFEQSASYMPFRVQIIDNKLWVYQNYSSQQLTEGSEIVAINGNKAADFVPILLNNRFNDGYGQGRRIRDIEFSFSKYYNVLIENTGSFKVEVIKPGQQNSTTYELNGVTAKAREQVRAERYFIPTNENARTPIGLSFTDDKTAVLTISTFTKDPYKRSGIKYDKFLDNAFDQLQAKGIEHLVIDLRSNFGGEDKYAQLLYSYIAEAPFKYYERMQFSTKKFKQLHYSYSSKIVKKLTFLFKKSKAEPGTYEWRSYKPLKEMKPQKNSFNGEVYVLTDGETFSAAADFSTIAKYKNRATFIGEETAGTTNGNSSGFIMYTRSPNTGVFFGYPVIKYTTAVEGLTFGRGVMPDYPLHPTIDDMNQQRDVELALAMELIKKAAIEKNRLVQKNKKP